MALSIGRVCRGDRHGGARRRGGGDQLRGRCGPDDSREREHQFHASPGEDPGNKPTGDFAGASGVRSTYWNVGTVSGNNETWSAAAQFGGALHDSTGASVTVTASFTGSNVGGVPGTGGNGDDDQRMFSRTWDLKNNTASPAASNPARVVSVGNQRGHEVTGPATGEKSRPFSAVVAYYLAGHHANASPGRLVLVGLGGQSNVPFAASEGTFDHVRLDGQTAKTRMTVPRRFRATPTDEGPSQSWDTVSGAPG